MYKAILVNSKARRHADIITNLDLAKKANSGLSIKSLSKILDVSSKTISRDLHECLNEFVERKGNTWYLKDSMDSKNDEELIIRILDEMAKGVGDEFHNKVQQFFRQFQAQINSPIYAHLNSEKLSNDDIKIFKILESAINKKIKISFSYTKVSNDGVDFVLDSQKRKSKSVKKFCVKPLKLAFFDGFWYLLAFDIESKKDSNITREVFKKFYIKDINNIALLNETFELSNKLQKQLKNAHNVWFQLQEPINVNLLIDKIIVKYFLRKPLPTQIIKSRYTNGDLEIQIKITHEMEITPIIFYYLPHIKVLSPSHLQKYVKDKITKYLEYLNNM
ncbi:WYL domain-containing protein [Helicobacter saguini]|uniref:WYL domain-containing protein n=1 Tax=Helicobacter saguini TaxID=1548018 RepID=A0A347VS92_9HELI|nr:WYL domain-containing protein [Helicobacter saguini]MWV62603.1 WYL domain-containing protein [Helicobacter saguini]MWV66725.1 WYL domain-containing protein [Helicobacter saguini]MWV69075.1 WYL domain-containing protein [Helicobacter saguini]MWV71371.1 WYL domain-containing protein [Helicobacter saguini]TLD94005.1 WYL domain-containing protein [Helicobacter saguini]